ncbi:hypothetical protein A9404_12145 [Halothiobacillus diazotrophicus]|uniref:Uncharacterized protein n=1 Tax=Halothiobacillus diazotrophicus TaxID=1860122 RepID=A0A191ZJG2_9GAMM|nr:hypothetical protein [Halothiobacillus diazotrophicus]ANJ68024.1 hypothetical protein A9404_12145 [Halothiobacillus diazotrophicus]
MHDSLTLAALWRLRALSLLTLGPGLGLLLVDRIFGLPVALRWQAAGVGLLMAGLFLYLVTKERDAIRHETQNR